MKHSIYIAWKYIIHHRVKSLILVLSMSLTASVPLCLHYLLKQFEVQLHARSKSTPLVVGRKGSSLDLTINSLYFTGKAPELITYGEVQRIDGTHLGVAIPVYNRFKASKSSIVGTSSDYFDLRKLEIAEGRSFAVLGDCVLGACVAARLKKKVGDTIDSSPENAFDFGGVYPLRMTVRGILHESGGPDDQAVFCDVMTCWIIEGLGHGHEDLKKAAASVILKKKNGNTVANASLFNYNAITAENIKGFHFHGDRSNYPLSAVIIAPTDIRSRDLLMAQYLAKDSLLQVVRPTKIMDELMEQLLNAEKFFLMVFSLVAIATLLMGMLVVILSLRLRRDEISTMYHLGCHRFKTLQILGSEIILLVLLSLVFTTCFALTLLPFQEVLLRYILY